MFKLRPCAGSLGYYEVLKEVTVPGQWYFERPSKYVALGPFQQPPEQWSIMVGFGRTESGRYER